ncbi:MAG: choice-of-anchor T family protein [Thermoplasmatota archaeon]
MRLVRFRLLTIMALVVLMGASGFLLFPDDAEAVGEAIVTVNPDSGQSALHAKVDPSRGGIVTFKGFVTLTEALSPDVQFVVVNLQAQVEGWEVTAIPILTLTSSFTQLQFAVSVRVPAGYKTSGLDATKIMTITGRWNYEPNTRSGDVQPLDVFIYIDQFYEYRVRCDTPFIQTSPGGEFDIEVEVINEGNGDDEVTIEIDRRDTMESNGWAFVFDTTKWDVPYQKSVKVPIHIATPKKWDGWRNNIVVIKFIVTSEQAIASHSVSESATYSIFIRQRGVSVPGFEPVLALFAIIIASTFFAYRRRR